MADDRSLLEFLDPSQVNCLNEASAHNLKGIMSSRSANTSSSYLLSDADEQLLITIPFNQTVRVKYITIRTDAAHAAQAPREIKLVINRQSVGFEDVADAKEPEVAQVITLSKAQVTEGQKVPLRFVRFQNVTSLHIFVASNQDEEDETRIDAIDVFGTPIDAGARDLKGLQQQEDH